jgi:tetratricopeptide (TPR) repeat protein
MAGAFGLGVALLILPFTVRNYWVGDDFVLLNSTGGMNVYMGNNARSNGAWVPPKFPMRADSPHAMQLAFKTVAEKETGRDMKPSEVSAHWQAKAVQYVLENPADWLELEGRKLLLYWNAREIWNNRSIDVSRGFSWVLRLPLLSFGVLAPFALLGMGLSRARWRELFPLLALVGVSVATALITFVLSRYRMGTVPILIIFGAYAVSSLIQIARQRRWQRVGLAVGWLVVLALLVGRDMGDENLFMAYYNLGNKYRNLGRHEEAIASYDKSLAIAPGFISTHNNMALAYEEAGRQEEAIEKWRHVARWARDRNDSRHLETARRHLRDLTGATEEREEADIE